MKSIIYLLILLTTCYSIYAAGYIVPNINLTTWFAGDLVNPLLFRDNSTYALNGTVMKSCLGTTDKYCSSYNGNQTNCSFFGCTYSYCMGNLNCSPLNFSQSNCSSYAYACQWLTASCISTYDCSVWYNDEATCNSHYPYCSSYQPQQCQNNMNCEYWGTDSYDCTTTGCRWQPWYCDGDAACDAPDPESCMSLGPSCDWNYDDSYCFVKDGYQCSYLQPYDCQSQSGCYYHDGYCTDYPNCQQWDSDQSTCQYYESNYNFCHWQNSDCLGENDCSYFSESDCNVFKPAGCQLQPTGCYNYGTCQTFNTNSAYCNATHGWGNCTWNSTGCYGTLACSNKNTSQCQNLSGCYNSGGVVQVPYGKYGVGMNFSGYLGDYLLIGNYAPLDLTKNWSILAWVNATSQGGGAIISRVVPSYQEGYMVTTNTNKMRCSLYHLGFGNQCDLDTISVVLNNSWVHLACIHNATSLTWYVNGRYDTSMSCAKYSTSQAGYSVGVGYRYDTSLKFAGKIDDLFVFNYTITNSELQNLMNGNYGSDGGTNCWTYNSVYHLLTIPPLCDITSLYVNKLLLI